MTTRVAFLRAVNVGRRKVAMPRLKAVVEGLGYDDVWTWINSGNVVFDTTGRAAEIEARLEEAFEAEFGFEVTTFTRTAAELRKVLAAEPFDVADGDTYLVTFLKQAPPAEAAAAFQACSNDFDTVVVVGREVHWRCHGRSSDTTLKKKDWLALGHFGGTSRNVNMLTKLVARIDAA